MSIEAMNCTIPTCSQQYLYRYLVASFFLASAVTCMPSDALAGLLVGPSQTTSLQSDSLETATADNLRDLLEEITEAPVGRITDEENTADPTTNDLLDLLAKSTLVLSTAETTNTDLLLYLLEPSAITTQNTVTATTTTAETSTEDLLADLLRSSTSVPTAPTQTSTDDGLADLLRSSITLPSAPSRTAKPLPTTPTPTPSRTPSPTPSITPSKSPIPSPTPTRAPSSSPENRLTCGIASGIDCEDDEIFAGGRECCLLDDGCGENYESNRCRSSFCCDEGPTGQERVCSDRVNESDCASDEELVPDRECCRYTNICMDGYESAKCLISFCCD